MTEVKHFEPTNQCFWNSERFDSLSNASLVVRFQLPPHGSRGQKRNFIPKPVDPTEKSIFDEWKPARSHHAFHPPRSQFIIIFPKIKSFDLSVRPSVRVYNFGADNPETAPETSEAERQAIFHGLPSGNSASGDDDDHNGPPLPPPPPPPLFACSGGGDGV